jgi:hypothetical protein
MNPLILQESIFGTNQTATDSNTNALNLSEAYPYCGLAHFFALKNDVNNESIAAKSSLFFKNSYYLQLLLQENEIANSPATEIITEEILAINDNEISKEPVIIFEAEEQKPEELLATANEVEDVKEVNEAAIVFPPINIPAETNTEETELKFEPLHTSDYFASQGIKLSSVVLPNDKLGMQLKSFTSWLKTMKKTHPEKLPTNNILAEVAIQKQAENSNIEAEVYTEPMAEAYVQQGKNIKAIEIYSKLSLMFPEKSAFFADKIENLK